MEGSGNGVKLTRRWMIAGTLTATSPLHVGSGNFEEDISRLKKKDKNEAVEFAAIARNHAGKPYIPGSTLKGVLRSWATEAKIAADFINQIFGTKNANDDKSVGGKADFFDVRATGTGKITQKPPHWDDDKLTGIMTSTQINRRTKTVSDGMLFHTEYVPAGVKFEVRIGGQDTNGKSDYDEIAQLIALFEGFNQKRVAIGSETGNGWGQFDWKLDTVSVFDPTIAKTWDTTQSVGYGALQAVDTETLAGIRKLATEKSKTAGNAGLLSIDLVLNFEGSFLVNDPSQKDDDDRSSTDPNNRKPDHAPLLDEKGLPWLPARSFRGAFRSQAERILRTIGGGDAACYPDGTGPRKTCGPVYKKDDVTKLCLACRLFGATGWRAPIEFTSFKPADSSVENTGVRMRQEFVAIDRFTGGSADGAKFNAVSYYQPKMKGTISLDAERLKTTGNADALRGLLVLTLRDLVEGDIRFGFGSAKGYGACTAEFSSVCGSLGIAAPTGFIEQLKTFFIDKSANTDATDLKAAVEELNKEIPVEIKRYLSESKTASTDTQESGDQTNAIS